MKKLLLILILTPLLVSAQKKKALELAYSFKPGTTIEVNQKTTQTINQSVMGMSQETKNEISGVMLYVVKEAKGKDAIIEAEYKSLKSKVSSAMANVSMDSEGDQEITENKIMKSMVGKKFSFTLSSTGVVSDITGTENILSGLDELGLDANMLAMMKQNLEQQYTGSGLKATLEGGFVQYADNKVKPNDQWQSTVGAGSTFPLLTTNTWTFDKVNGKEASINASGNIITTDKDKTFPLQMGMKGKTDLSGEQQLSSRVSLDDGWPIEYNVNSHVKGMLTILAGAMLPDDMDVPMEIKTESVFTFVRK